MLFDDPNDKNYQKVIKRRPQNRPQIHQNSISNRRRKKVYENRRKMSASGVPQGPKWILPFGDQIRLKLPPGPQKNPGILPLLKTDLEVAQTYPKINKK